MIQKLEQSVIGTDYGCGGATFSEVIDKVNEVIDYINSLPEEKPSEDLEVAADEYADDNFEQWVEDDEIYSDADKIRETFIAGAEWQKQRDAELIEIAYNDGITIGKTKQKEQMMKDSEEDALLLERAWLTLDGFGHEELAERLRQFAERKGLIWK